MAYPANTNKRVFYATQAVAVGDKDGSTVIDSWSSGSAIVGTGKLMVAHGLQSIGITTNFNLEQIFELGQLSLYENYEEVPEIEVTFEKLLDGYSLMYHLGTVSSTAPTLTGRGNARADVRMAVGFDTKGSMITVDQSGVAELYCSGMYLSSVSYSLGTDGNFTESTTFVGNDKRWLKDTAGKLLDANGVLASVLNSGLFGEDAPPNSVLRRQNLVIGSGGRTFGVVAGSGGYAGFAFTTQVPSILEGGTSGNLTNSKYIIEGSGPFIQSVSISCDLGRESIQQLGKKAPYYRYVNFPVDVTCDIEVTATAGDNVNAAEESKNLSNHSIQIVLDDSTVFQLGKKNKLTSISYGGGDAGGGNATITYSFTNSNDFVVLHSGDPAVISEANYWKNHFA